MTTLTRCRFAVSLTAMAAMTIPARAADMTAIRVGTLPIDNGAEVLYGIDRGFFARNGLTVELQTLSNGAAITAAVAANAIDVGFSNLFSVVQAFAKGIPLTVIAPAALYDANSPAQALMVLKNTSMKTAKDLDGKTIGVDGLKTITQVTTAAWIDQNGGDASSVRWIEIPGPLQGQALIDHRVDAVSSAMSDNPDVGTASSQLKIFALPYDSVGKHFLASGWFTTKSWASAHPDAVKRFATAIVAAGKWANANKSASAPVLAKYTKIAPERLAMIAHNRAVYDETPLRPASLEAVIDFSAKQKLIDASFPPATLAFSE